MTPFLEEGPAPQLPIGTLDPERAPPHKDAAAGELFRFG